MQNLAGKATRGQGRQTFFLDVERKYAQEQKGSGTLGGSKKPSVPPGAKHWQQGVDFSAAGKSSPAPKRGAVKAKARPKPGVAYAAMPSYQKELFNRLDNNRDGKISEEEWARALQRPETKELFFQVAGGSRGGYPQKSDPLNLKQPPQDVDTQQQELTADGDYLPAGINPDSLLADVEALLAQERMLAEQTKWWEDRATQEKTSRRRLQDEMKAQEATFKQEVEEMHREIAIAREQQLQEEARQQDVINEAAELRAEAAAAQEEADLLRQKLEQVAGSAAPSDAAKIRASISAVARHSTSPRPFGSMTSSVRGYVSHGASPFGSQTTSARASVTAATASAMDGGANPRWPARASQSSMGGGAKPPAKAASAGLNLDDEDFDDDIGDFGGGASLGGAVRGSVGFNIGANPSSSAGNGGLAMDNFGEHDDDLDMGALGFG